MNNSADIAVIGAGLVGSLVSAYLGQRGHQVTVYDKRPDMRKEGVSGGRSINLALSDRGLKALSGVGIAEEVRKLCIPMHGRMMHDPDGKLTFQPYGKEGQFINSVSRGGLNMLLMDRAEALEKVDFRFEQKLVKYETKSAELLMHDMHQEENYRVKPEVIFGADGAFSRLRYSLQKRPLFNYSQDYLEHGYKELRIPPAEDGSWRIDKNALHIWPRRSFMLIALPNLDGSFTVTLFAPFEGPQGFDALTDDTKVMAYFEEYFGDTLELMPDLKEDFFRNPTSGLVTVHCEPWAYRNTLLIGDAAHAIVPFYGQGMNSGFEDCTILDQYIGRYEGDWEATFEAFEAERKPDADAIAELAKRNFIEMRDRVADPLFLLRKKIAAAVSERHPDHFIPVYSMVTFSHLPYSKALAEMDRQDRLFGEILSWEGIEERWERRYLERIEELLLDGQS